MLDNLFGGDEKSAEEKVRDKQVRQDSLSMNKLEAQLAAKKNSEKNENNNELLNPQQTKFRLKQQLLNLEPQEVEVKYVICNSEGCGEKYEIQTVKEAGKCPNCGNSDKENFKLRLEEETRWVKRSKDSLVNKEGFSKIAWSEAESVINETTAGGYLDDNQIGSLVYSSLATVTMQYSLYFWKYGVDNPSDMQQIGDILRTPMAVQASKARGGRGLKNQESTRVEKVAKTITGGDEDESDDNIF